jgi:hippurate hydrolase
MSRHVPVLALIGLLAAGSPAAAEEGDPWVRDHLGELVALYKDLHAHPELSWQETATARRVAEELKKAGAEVTTGVGKNGVVGVLKNGKGPTVLVRSDLDALPVTEETGLPYASRVTASGEGGRPTGVMHACGHDVHMACLVGVAGWLAEHRDRWAGTVVLVGQPAEELVEGARAMLDDGLYRRFPKPDAALALHVVQDQPTGTVAYTSGPALAGTTSLDLIVKGRGGHGAAPHTTVDPVVLAALAVLDLQTIVSRELDPVQPGVVTIGSIHGGTKHNIIPNEVKLQLTLRAYQEDVLTRMVESIRRRAQGLAAAHRAPDPELKIVVTNPPTINDPALVEKVLPALRRVLGPDHVLAAEPVMGAEDFALYRREGVPTFMFRLGTIPPDRVAEARAKGEVLPSLHSSRFRPEPEGSIGTGVRAMTAAVVELLKPTR